MILQTDNDMASDNSSKTVQQFIKHYVHLQSVMLGEEALFIVASKNNCIQAGLALFWAIKPTLLLYTIQLMWEGFMEKGVNVALYITLLSIATVHKCSS